MIFKKKEPQKDSGSINECNHIFYDYTRTVDPRRMCITMYLRCELCNETISLNVTSGMLADLFSDMALNGCNPFK